MSEPSNETVFPARTTSMIRRFLSGTRIVFRFLRVSIANILVIILLVGLFAVLFSPSDMPKISQDSVLLVDLEGQFVEEDTSASPLGLLFGSLQELRGTRVQDVVDGIAAAAVDPRITGLALKCSRALSVNQAQIERIETALMEFKKSGKKSVAHGIAFSQAQYRIASAADVVLMDPLGELFFRGISTHRAYFASFIEKLSVQVNVFKSGTYKDAVEPYILDSMSEESREAKQVLVDEIWDAYRVRVANNRSHTIEEFDQYIENFSDALTSHGGDNVSLALENGWIDEIAILDEKKTELSERLSSDRFVSLKDYVKVHRTKQDTSNPNIVSVVTASGLIVSGKGEPGLIGSKTLSKTLNELAENENVKAVVLHVDSPGGSAYASELIRRAVLNVKAAKPIVTSMAGVAASGGYWISAHSSEIWANPSTITGSIGVFGMVPTIETSMKKIGISRDGVGTTPFSRDDLFLSDLSEQTSKVIQASVTKIYEDFIQIVAEGRSMNEADVREVAEGRVWTGSQAQELGLVDELGGLDSAIAAAARLAKLERYRVERARAESTPLETVLRFLEESARGEFGLDLGLQGAHLSSIQSMLASEAHTMRLLQEPRNVLAICGACGLQMH